MTKRDKVVMLSAVLLAFCVIVSTFLFSANSNENNGNVNVESLIYVSAVIIIGIISVAAVYFTKVRKGKYEKMLNTAYFKEYEIIRDAIMNSQLSDKSKKETVEDILDMLLEAQKAGKSIDVVIGNPVEFSQKIICEYSRLRRFVILSLFDGIIAFALFVIGVTTVLWLEQVDKGFFSIGVDISMVMFFVIVAFLIIPATKKLTSTKNPWMFMIPLFAGIAYILVTMILRKYFYSVELVKALFDGSIIMIPNMIAFMMYLLVIPILMKLKSFIRKQPIRE